jgi:Leucine-rich repeat (LRR) protein
MPNEEKLSLIAHGTHTLARDYAAGKRITEEMAAGALEIITHKSTAHTPRFRISDHLLCEPDYRQIVVWAKELGISAEDVLASLLLTPKGGLWFWKNDMGTKIVNGQFLSLSFNRNLLPVSSFQWVDGLEIESMVAWGHASGIEYFSSNLPSLQRLHLHDQEIPSIILDSTLRLRELRLINNRLSNLEIGAGSELRELWCVNNLLGEINLATTPKLEKLSCSGNRIATLALEFLPRLTSLYCKDNLISDLDLSKTPLLERLICSNNPIAEIDITPLFTLQHLEYEKAKTHLTKRPDQLF